MIASPLRPRHRQEPGIAAAGQLAHQGTPYGASLSFATTTHLWPLPDPPSRKPRSATSRTGIARSIPGRALASSVSGSPCQGPGTGLPPPISTSVPGTPAKPSPYGLGFATTGAYPRGPKVPHLRRAGPARDGPNGRRRTSGGRSLPDVLDLGDRPQREFRVPTIKHGISPLHAVADGFSPCRIQLPPPLPPLFVAGRHHRHRSVNQDQVDHAGRRCDHRYDRSRVHGLRILPIHGPAQTLSERAHDDGWRASGWGG